MSRASRSRVAVVVACASAVITTAVANAKDFAPGDLRICGADRCVPITRPAVLPALGSFYYSGLPLAHVAQPRLGSPVFELRFRNGYATGIAATARLDRFLSYGVHLERFAQSTWYRIPPGLAAELRRLAAPLTPMRLTRAALARSR